MEIVIDGVLVDFLGFLAVKGKISKKISREDVFIVVFWPETKVFFEDAY